MNIDDDTSTSTSADLTDTSSTDTPGSTETPVSAEHIETNDDGTLRSGEDKQSLDDKAVAAFMQGVKEATPAPKEADDAGASSTAPEAKPAASATTSAAAQAKTAYKPEAAAPAAAPKDETVEKEITDLKLKDKAAARFRELSSTVKESAPYVETLRELGINTPEKLNTILQDAARGMEFEDAIHRVNATPEQFSGAMQIIGGMNSGDPVLLNATFDAMLQTLEQLGQRLGRPITSSHDPLAQHPDLQRAVGEDMTMTREAALEVARARATERESRASRERTVSAVQQQDVQQQEMTRAQQRAMADIDEFSAEMERTDPHFAHKLAILTPLLDTITRNTPPSRWEREIAKAYRQIPNPTAVAAPVQAARAPIRHVPTRGGGAPLAAGNGGGSMRAEPKDDYEAFLRGVADATPRR